MFINFNVNTGLSLNTYRSTNAVYGDLDELLQGMEDEINICCDAEGAIEMLEGAMYLHNSDIKLEHVEAVYNLLAQ